ncbi:MAG: DNA repair protein RadC [Verrucomicrobia bacterium]|nr:DNA repair protein RadC [Verrucomicrobiota bacterium]
MSLCDIMPPSELPRERLMREGTQSLSSSELIAILLGTGTQGKSVLILAQELLLRFGGIQGLQDASIEELIQIKGMGKAKAITLKAALGIAQRVAQEQELPQKKIITIQDVVGIAQPLIGHLKKEAFLVILRDVKCRLIHREIISLGTLSEVLVHPREVFEFAIKHRAHSLVVCHNHPSGDPSPSKQDIELTHRLCECAEIIGVKLADHLIICKNSYYSFKNKTV